MNKKVLTLCAGLLLAGNATAWGADYDATSRPSSRDGKYQMVQVTNTFNQFNKDANSIVTKSAFPNVSPFAVKQANGAKAITDLEDVNGKADSRYFQFVVGKTGSTKSDGQYVLTMIFVQDGAQGHYEVQIENVQNANFNDSPIKLDRTLWKVTAKKDAAGTVLYYELQNKATDAILQLSTTAVGAANTNGFSAASLKIVAGQTDWRWADGQTASQASSFDANLLSGGSNNNLVLQNTLRAQFNNGTTLHLAMKKSGTNKYELGAVIGNSNTPFVSETIGSDTYTPITFEAWEANPIILTADQINNELGNDLYDGQGDGKFHFTFAPDVIGDSNIMTASDFTAVAPKSAADERVPGDAADGFVRFQKKGTNEFLMIDTTYYNEAAQDRYELKMAVREITYPRYAVIADGRTIDKVKEQDKKDGSLYIASSFAPQTAKALVQLKRQSNFRPIFYPATQSLRLQAEMIYKKDKSANKPWWEQAAAAVNASNHLEIAPYAENNGVNPIAIAGSGKANAVGYYPAYIETTDNSNSEKKQFLGYKTAFTQYVPSNTTAENGYNVNGEAAPATGSQVWNAIGNVNTGTTPSLLVVDPAKKAATLPNIFNYNAVQAISNVVKLVTLTSDHKVLTTDVADPTDADYNGLLTFISLEGLRQNSNLSQVVDIPEGFYYIQNANKKPSQLNKYGDYRYEDLAATNAMFTYWNNVSEKWDRGVSTTDGTEPNATTSNYTKDNSGINAAEHKADKANIGNLVYSSEKLTIPSAQWYIKGNGDHYVMINRESGRQWGTEYWWATDEDNVYVNQATYTDAAGQQQTYRDTIRLTQVPDADLADIHLGYLNLTKDEALADTTVYNIGMQSLGETRYSLSDVNGVLTMKEDANGEYKLERALVTDKDPYVSGNAATKKTDELIYGYFPAGADSTKLMLTRAKYYIYKDEVSANSGIEPSSIKTRQYITLSEGQYVLTPVEVKFDDNLYSMNTEADEINDTDNVKTRRAFYVKQMTADANKFVLVDPAVVTTTQNATSTKTAFGARVFVNQLNGKLQPGSLISDGYANSYASSILDLAKVGRGNYADIRTAGQERDTVNLYTAKNDQYLLSENTEVEGANVGLLELREFSDKINTALFVDTANVDNAACPRFLLGLRNVDSVEVSNIDPHNRHILTKAAYLVNMIDSADANKAYVYKNIDQNKTAHYRLGFMEGTHQGSTLTLDKSGKKFDLSSDKLGETGLNYATFAFRYTDTSRENFYIETQYDATRKGWIIIHNGVACVTPNIQEAEVFSFSKSTVAPTANDEIATSEVSVVAVDGAVVIKNAAGKKVAINNILGKSIANETISSDNETIAVPAGIVVVAVEGEEAAKVVVK